MTELAQADAAMRAGRFEIAAARCEDRLATHPEDLMARGLLGTARAAMGDFAGAEAAFVEVLRLAPGHRPATIALARAIAAQDRRDEAFDLLRDIETDDPIALREIADAFVAIGSPEAALDALTRWRQGRPRDPDAMFRHAHVLGLLGRKEEAVAAYREGLALRPEVGPAHANLGLFLCEQSRYEAARQEYAAAIKLSGGAAGPRFLRAGLSPVIHDSAEAIDQLRARMASEFEELTLQRARLRHPLAEVGASTALTTYHGRPNRDLQTTIAKSYRAACHDLERAGPLRGSGGPRIRVGLCSGFLWGHTIGRVMLGLLRELDRSRFEVVLLRVGRTFDALGRALDAAADRVVLLPPTLEQARETIAQADLDVLLYSEFGAEPMTTFLAYARLAPVQGVLWGFPDTSGVPNLDYYASTALFEPDNAQDHYSETLIAFPRLYSFMDPPDGRAEPITKQSLGIDEDDRLYLCAQSLYKAHPEFDPALAGILARDPKARVAFFEGPEPHWRALLEARFARTIPDANRIVFLPHLPSAPFRGALQIANAVIDTKHFTGGYTTYLSFAAHVPVVTWDGDLMRGRMTQGLYRSIDVEPLSAQSDDAFADLAVEIAGGGSRKRDVQIALADRAEGLFEDYGALRDFERFLIAAHASAQEGRKLTGWDDVRPLD